jgi:hypothetical protein
MLQGCAPITRGLGTKTVVARGFGGLGIVIEAARRIIRGGRSALKKAYDICLITVAARMVSAAEYCGIKSKTEALEHGFPDISGVTRNGVSENSPIVRGRLTEQHSTYDKPADVVVKGSMLPRSTAPKKITKVSAEKFDGRRERTPRDH